MLEGILTKKCKSDSSIALESQLVLVDDITLKPDYTMTKFSSFASSIGTVHSYVEKFPDPAAVTRPLRNAQPLFSHFMRNS